MKTANKLTITLSPEEVKKAVTYYVHATYGAQIQDGHPEVYFNVEPINQDDRIGMDLDIFTGATVEVTQP